MENDIVRLDCSKITTLEEVKILLQGMDIKVSITSPVYQQLKHLIYDN